MKLKVACIQTNALDTVEANLKLIEPMIREARDKGADFITTPENVALIVQDCARVFAAAVTEDAHPAVAFFKKLAKETGAWLLAGSIGVSTDDGHRYNRSLLFNPKGEIAARYDKIHMFDAVLSATESYRESEKFRHGPSAVLATTPWGKVGMTVCYDVRFPQLYRALAKAGANIITVPAAFAATTGRMHWHVLLRARAIETGCYILAPAQCGVHDRGRLTYGHSLIVAPNGEVIADGGETPGILMAELDLEKVTEARRMLPSLQHDREFAKP